MLNGRIVSRSRKYEARSKFLEAVFLCIRLFLPFVATLVLLLVLLLLFRFVLLLLFPLDCICRGGERGGGRLVGRDTLFSLAELVTMVGRLLRSGGQDLVIKAGARYLPSRQARSGRVLGCAIKASAKQVGSIG